MDLNRDFLICTDDYNAPNGYQYHLVMKQWYALYASLYSYYLCQKFVFSRILQSNVTIHGATMKDIAKYLNLQK